MVRASLIKNLYARYFLLLWRSVCEKLSFQTRHVNIHRHHVERRRGTAPAGKEAWQEVLNRALEGDIQQLGRLCQEYLKPKLYPFALTLLKNSHDAEDVVQDAFARLLTNYQRI